MIKNINKSKKNIKLQNKKTKTQKGGKTSMKKFKKLYLTVVNKMID